MKKIVVSWIVCVLGLVGLLVWLGTGVVPKNPQPEDTQGLITADFTLQGAKHKTVTAKDLRGKYLLIYFGFTHCPNICPTTLLLMNNVLSDLGERADQVQPIFITLDPERDTPDIANAYAGRFGKPMLGLSGTPQQIKQAADNFKVYYSKVEDKSSALGYVIDHSGFVYLVGPDGKYLTHFANTAAEQELKQGLMEYVK